MAKNPTLSESDILADVLAADHGDLRPDVARAVLKWKFSAGAVRRINRLADRNRKGTISETEKEDLQSYLRVGSLVNLIQAKARLSLNRSRTSES
jgi:hypothetical protein